MKAKKKTSRSVTFTEFRKLLQGLDYKLKRTGRGEIFHHKTEGLLLFRRYADDEEVYPGDVLRVRKILDLRGMLSEEEFDTRLQHANKPA